MTRTIAILDDEPDRLNAMQPLLTSRFPSFVVSTFDNAPDMIDWLREHLDSCILICLDHDLGPNRNRDGEVFDPGIGRDVVDYLATRKPTCHIIIHTTNTDAAPGMEFALRDASWSCSRVVPYEDVLWIREVWIDEVITVLAKELDR